MDLKLEEEVEMPQAIQKCGICDKNDYKYVCPRCNVLYCSVPCYKSQMHLDCSESFYKESIEDMLKIEAKNPASKQKMEDILRRMNEPEEYESDDSDDADDISERLKDIDLDDAESVWDKLTEEERKEFMELVKNGDTSSLIPSWEPWWDEKHPVPKVRELQDETHDSYKKNCPVLRQVPNLSSIAKKQPSPLIYFNVVNTIASYALLMRYYNGNFDNLILEAATIYIEITKSLSSSECYQSIDLALASVSQAATVCQLIETSQENISQMKEDTVKILEGPNEEEADYYVRVALSDIHSFLQSVKKKKPARRPINKFSQHFPETTENNTTFVGKDILTKCIKKIEYYESWALEHYLSVNV